MVGHIAATASAMDRYFLRRKNVRIHCRRGRGCRHGDVRQTAECRRKLALLELNELFLQLKRREKIHSSQDFCKQHSSFLD